MGFIEKIINGGSGSSRDGYSHRDIEEIKSFNQKLWML